MTLVIKKIDEQKLREFKAEAIRRGLTLSQALGEAIDLWLRKVKEELPAEADLNNKVYEEMNQNLEKRHRGKYAVIAQGRLIGLYEQLSQVVQALKALKGIQQAIVIKIGEDKPPPRELTWLGGSTEPSTA